MNKMVKYTTPKGVAQYPYLDKPDTKFNPQGDYKLNLVLDKKSGKITFDKGNYLTNKKLIAKAKEGKIFDVYDIVPIKSEQYKTIMQPKNKLLSTGNFNQGQEQSISSFL